MFDSVLRDAGGMWGAAGGSGPAPRGDDIEARLDLTFAEAVFGVTKDVEVTADAPCDTCGGSGAKAGTGREAVPAVPRQRAHARGLQPRRVRPVHPHQHLQRVPRPGEHRQGPVRDVPRHGPRAPDAHGARRGARRHRRGPAPAAGGRGRRRRPRRPRRRPVRLHPRRAARRVRARRRRPHLPPRHQHGRGRPGHHPVRAGARRRHRGPAQGRHAARRGQDLPQPRRAGAAGVRPRRPQGRGQRARPAQAQRRAARPARAVRASSPARPPTRPTRASWTRSARPSAGDAARCSRPPRPRRRPPRARETTPVHQIRAAPDGRPGSRPGALAGGRTRTTGPGRPPTTPARTRQALQYADARAVAAILALQPAGWQEEDGGRTLVFWLEDGAAADAGVAAALRDLGTLGRLEVRREPPGWEDAWRRFHKPHVIGRLYVRPPWYPARDDLLDIAVEAGLALRHRRARQHAPVPRAHPDAHARGRCSTLAPAPAWSRSRRCAWGSPRSPASRSTPWPCTPRPATPP